MVSNGKISTWSVCWKSFEGKKEKDHVTKKFIDISLSTKRNIDNEEIKLEYLGRGHERLNLGTHKGNSFVIVVRNIVKKPKKIEKMLNLFDSQRFESKR